MLDRHRALIVAVVCGLATNLCAAQPPSSPDANRQAHALIDAALAKYRAAKTYEDQLQATMKLVLLDKEDENIGEEDTFSASVAFERPNRAAQVSENAAIHSDGQNLWLYLELLDEYMVSKTPESLDWGKIADGLGAGPPHPVMIVLAQPHKSFDELFPMVNGFTSVAPETRAGRPGQRVRGTFDATRTPLGIEDQNVPFSLWFDDKTGLLGEFQVDLTNAFREMHGLTGDLTPEQIEQLPPGMPKRIDAATATMAFNDAKVDTRIPADRFTFTPPAGAQKVDEFTAVDPANPPNPRSLIGKAAPLFAGEDLEGNELSLQKLRGRVVVLDFWATWCMPCIMAMPTIQKLHEKYADQPVTIIGINQDDKRTAKAVGPLLEGKKITFRHFPDHRGKLGIKYKVSGIPCTFIIDKQGIIREVHTGFSPTLEKELAENIDKLLKTGT